VEFAAPLLKTSHVNLFNELLEEFRRQIRAFPPGFPANRTGIRAGIGAARDELFEAWSAWNVEKKSLDDDQWKETRAELLQAAAVIVYTLACMDDKWREDEH